MQSNSPLLPRCFRPRTLLPGSRRTLTTLIAAGQVLSSLVLTAQNLPSPTPPVPPPWDFTPVPDPSGQWWRTLRIHNTVPGVGYELPASPNLKDWSAVANRYGNGRP